MSRVFDYFLNQMLDSDEEYHAWLDERDAEYLDSLDKQIKTVFDNNNNWGSSQIAKGELTWQKEN